MHGKVHIGKAASRGRGVFSDTHYSPGDVVLECPCIDVTHNKIGAESEILDYVFEHPDDERKSVVALGYCSLANHEDDPNSEWVYAPRDHPSEQSTMVLRARRDIPVGAEVTISYGNEWWTKRERKPV